MTDRRLLAGFYAFALLALAVHPGFVVPALGCVGAWAWRGR
jgi:hypothetical protein